MIGSLPLVETSATSNFLGSTLMNPNGIAHPTIMYGLLRNWGGVTPFSKQPLFYQAIDEFTANALTAVSSEILQIKMAIQKLYPNIDLAVVRSIGEFFEVAYGKCFLLAWSGEYQVDTRSSQHFCCAPCQFSGRYCRPFEFAASVCIQQRIRRPYNADKRG